MVRLDGAAHNQKLLDGQAHRRCQLLQRGLPTEALFKLSVGVLPARNQFHHIGRNVDGLYCVDQGSLDGLLDPPTGVGTESGTLRGVKPFDGLDEADVAFFDEVGERQPAVGVVFGDGDHQAKVRLDHPILGAQALIVDDAPAQHLFLVGSKESFLLDFSEVELKFVLDTGSRHTPSRSANQNMSHTLTPGVASYAPHRQSQGWSLEQVNMNVKLFWEFHICMSQIPTTLITIRRIPRRAENLSIPVTENHRFQSLQTRILLTQAVRMTPLLARKWTSRRSSDRGRLAAIARRFG